MVFILTRIHFLSNTLNYFIKFFNINGLIKIYNFFKSLTFKNLSFGGLMLGIYTTLRLILKKYTIIFKIANP